MGRFLSTDPLTIKYPDFTPYSYAANSPVWLVDKDGEEPDRNQSGTINQAAGQWAKLKNQTVDGILDYLARDPNAVKFIYTKNKGWIDLQHYFGTIKYGQTAMNLLEPASGNKILQQKVFGPGANSSYYSYEDLPSNQFAAEARNLTTSTLFPTKFGPVLIIEETKTGQDLINSVKENFTNAQAVNPESAPNWSKIPFKDHDERERLPEIRKYIKSWRSYGIMGAGHIEETLSPVYYTKEEKALLLRTGKYVPQNHSTTPYDLNNFPSAPSSLEEGDSRKGATGH